MPHFHEWLTDLIVIPSIDIRENLHTMHFYGKNLEQLAFKDKDIFQL